MRACGVPGSPACQAPGNKGAARLLTGRGLAKIPRALGTQTRLLLLAVLILEPGDHRRIREGGRVAQRLALRNVAGEPPHDLAASVLGEVGGENEVVGALEGRAILLDM